MEEGLALDSLAPEDFGIRGPPRRQPVLPAGHGLGSLETGVSTEPLLVLDSLASELADFPACSPCCQPAMDLGPWRQGSRRNLSSPWTHLLQRASEFAAVSACSSTTRGRPDMRFCVCGSPRGDLSHIASVTLARSVALGQIFPEPIGEFKTMRVGGGN